MWLHQQRNIIWVGKCANDYTDRSLRLHINFRGSCYHCRLLLFCKRCLELVQLSPLLLGFVKRVSQAFQMWTAVSCLDLYSDVPVCYFPGGRIIRRGFGCLVVCFLCCGVCVCVCGGVVVWFLCVCLCGLCFFLFVYFSVMRAGGVLWGNSFKTCPG